ncbi:MAG: electron transfer flavoprotein subunit beta/FixA family protein [Nitrospirae bacterium]|nr:electron transfer flavoprotein subunit beta/FixA family protein [Nitrospirota bacterium]
MKILTTVKRVPDPETKIKVKPDGSGIVTENVKFVINPFDEIAIEESIRIKEKVSGSEIVLVSVGPKVSTEQIRTGLAMGADRGILVVEESPLDPDSVAQILQKVVQNEKPDLIVMGKQAIDDDSNQVAQSLAEYLGYPQACFASKVEVAADAKSATVTREVDGGLEVKVIQLPAVITADLRLNQPRYASLPGIMKARSKPIQELNISGLGISLAPKVKVLKMEAPPKRKGGVKLESVDQLIDKLKNEARVI